MSISFFFVHKCVYKFLILSYFITKNRFYKTNKTFRICILMLTTNKITISIMHKFLKIHFQKLSSIKPLQIINYAKTIFLIIFSKHSSKLLIPPKIIMLLLMIFTTNQIQ
jgi:hypothetical protein